MSRGRQLNAKNTNRVADGLILWSFQHAGLAGGSSEWLGCRVGGQGDLADQYDLLSASSLSSLSSVSLLIGLLQSFVTGRRETGGLVIYIFGFSVLQMM